VLVRSVEKGASPPKRALRAGDVIVRVNGEPVTDVGDFSQALRSHKTGKRQCGRHSREKEQTISLPVPERKHSGMLEESMEAPEVRRRYRFSADPDRYRETGNHKFNSPFAMQAKRPRRNGGSRKAMAKIKIRIKIDQEKLARELRQLQRETAMKLHSLVRERDMI